MTDLFYPVIAIMIWDDILYLVVLAAISLAAAYLLAPDPPSINPLDDPDKSQAGIRGTISPIMLGHNKVSPVLGYVGNRHAWEKKIGTQDGGLWHSDKDITQTNFWESGMHILCVGPARRLHKIIDGGTTIFDQELDSVNHPSGQDIFRCNNAPFYSSFRIYWGEQDQPVDDDLAENTGVHSRRPYCCYIYWISHDVGVQALWGTIEYVMECATLGEDSQFLDFSEDDYNVDVVTAFYTQDRTSWMALMYPDKLKTNDPLAANIQVGDGIIPTTGEPSTVVSNVWLSGGYYYIKVKKPWWSLATYDTPYEITIRPVGTEARGCNPALITKQLLFYDFPHGLSMKRSLFDMASLEDLITYFAEDGTEPAPSSVLIKSGRSIKAALSGIFQDYGIGLYPDYETGKYVFKIIRAGETAIPLTDEYIDLTKLTETKAYSVLAPDKMVYSFLDSARNFSTSTILVDDDGQASLTGNPNARKVALNTPTDMATASTIASRREQEASIDRAVTVPVSTEKESLNIGDTITFESLSGVWRLVSKSTEIDKASVDMSFTLDAYSIDNNYIQNVEGGIQISQDAAPDVYLRILEGNRYLDRDLNGYYVVRQPAEVNVAGAELYKSLTDVTDDFQSVAQLPAGIFGILTEELAEDASIDTLEITAFGDDFTRFWEEEVTDAQWRSGKNLAIVGDELISVKSITVIDNTTIQLNDLLRGRFGTTPAVHAVDDTIGFFSKEGRVFIEDGLLLTGETAYFRSRPYTTSSVLDLDEAISESLLYNGGGYRPLTPENLNTTDDTASWINGDDVDLRWDYKNATSLTGAGFSLSDEVAEPSLPEGYFKLTILSGTTVVREEPVLVNTFTYTQAMMVEDFGSEPSTFNVEVEEVLNGLTSASDSRTITRV